MRSLILDTYNTDISTSTSTYTQIFDSSRTTLESECCSGNDTTGTAVDRGINPEKSSDERTLEDETALHKAVRCNDEEMVKYLVQDVDVNTKNADGDTPLHLAREEAIAEILLQAGADASSRNVHNEMPVHVAAKNDYAGVLKVNLEAGADINATATGTKIDFIANPEDIVEEKRTPFQLALMRDCVNSLKILFDANARIDTDDIIAELRNREQYLSDLLSKNAPKILLAKHSCKNDNYPKMDISYQEDDLFSIPSKLLFACILKDIKQSTVNGKHIELTLKGGKNINLSVQQTKSVLEFFQEICSCQSDNAKIFIKMTDTDNDSVPADQATISEQRTEAIPAEVIKIMQDTIEKFKENS